MNKFLKVMFALVIVAMTGAAILQIVAPEYMGSNAAYGISTGWQREIGFWNLAGSSFWLPLVSTTIGSIYVQFCSR